MNDFTAAAFDLASQFTERKVYLRLAALLPDRPFKGCAWDRWSVVGDSSGIATQVRTTTKLYPNNQDVAAYTAIPEEAFDPARADLAAKYGLVWIRLSDIHPLATTDEYVGCLWPGKETVFFRITASACTRSIHRYDGPSENGYTSLMLAVFNHYDTLEWTRWASDITRAARDNVNYALAQRSCEDRGLLMKFGTATYHPVRDREALAILGIFGKKDDYERRQKLTGTYLQKAKDGGAPRSERQMPYGFRHARLPGSQRRIKDATRGYMPEAMWSFVPTLQEIVHAAVKKDPDGRYVTPMREVTRLLAVHQVMRRGQTAEGGYAALFPGVDPADPAAVAGAEHLDGEALYRVGRSFFVNNGFLPRPAAERAKEPDLTLEERLYLHKVLLWKTGTFLQKRESDVRGRDAEAKGERPTFRGPLDEFGYFLMEARWGFPVDPDTGQELVGWGIPEEVWDELIARLLAQTRVRRPRGGRSHAAERRRFLEDFGTWTTEGEESNLEWSVGARQNNALDATPGRQNIIILCRTWAEGTKAGGGRHGWSVQQTNPRRHVKATANLAELAGDLRCQLSEAVATQLLDVGDYAPLVLPARRPQRNAVTEQIAALELKRDAAEREAAKLRAGAEALRAAAAEFLGEGNSTKFRQYDAMADQSDTTAEQEENKRLALTERITTLRLPAPVTDEIEEAEVNLTPAAYLNEALRRAALNNGRVPWRAAVVAAGTFAGWAFTPDGDLLHYRCLARLPLIGGGHLELELAGTITNVRGRAGKASIPLDTTAHALFAQGRTLEELASTHGTTRHALVIKRVMPWLVSMGVTERTTKCALLDHPLAAPRSVVYARLTRAAPGGHQRYSAAWRQLIEDVYVDRPRPWGFAACPDDTTAIHQIAATLALPQHRDRGLPVHLLETLTGADIRDLVTPTDRETSGLGFTRPRYLEFVPGSNRERVWLRRCPHPRCHGIADRVLLLPEVAASCWGVLCSTCWRAPATVDPKAGPGTAAEQGRWANIVFPAEYDNYISGQSGTGGSLRLRPETLIVQASDPFDIAATKPR